MAKSNSGSSMSNQGDRKTSMKMASKGANIPLSGYSQAAKQDAKRWKSKGKMKGNVPTWLA